MGTIFEEDGKAYLVENGRVVAASTNKESLVATPSAPKPFGIGDRVEYAGKLGSIISSMQTVYGTAFGLRLDSGDLDSAYPEQLKFSDIEAPSYESALDELAADFDRYENAPSETLDEVREKAALARALNVRAKALMTDPTLGLGDQVQADNIITATAHDLVVLKDEEMDHLATSEYVRNQPRYELPEEVFAATDWSREDASWLELEAEEVQAEIDNVDWDAYLSEQAVTLADQVEDPDDAEVFETAVESRFARLASHAFTGDAYTTRAEQFKALVNDAVKSRPVEKVAKVVELPEIDDPDFLWS